MVLSSSGIRLAAILFAAAVATPAAAQETADAVDATAVGGIEEVTVTARKREESLQEVPLSVTAFSEKSLESAGIRSILDVANFTPGFIMPSEGERARDTYIIRGMNSNSNRETQQNVSVFIDGIYVNGSPTSADFQALERVEVIRGPQSALFGRATFAGAINFVTRAPTNDFEGRVFASAASDEEHEIAATVSGPIVEDRLFYRLSARDYRYGGESEWINSVDGEQLGIQRSRNVSGQLRWVPVDNFDATLRFGYAQDDDESYPRGYIENLNCQFNFPNAAGVMQTRNYYCGEVPSRPVEVIGFNFDEANTDPGVQRDQYRTSLVMNLEAAGHTFTSVTAYNEEDAQQMFDFDLIGTKPLKTGAAPDLAQNGAFRTFSDFSQEFRVTSPGDRRFRYLAGVSYYDGEWERQASFQPLTYENTKMRNYSIFGSASYDFTDALTISLEARLQEDKVEDVGVNMRRNPAQLGPFETTFTSFLPRLLVDYKINDDVMVFFNAAKGNNPGGGNATAVMPVDAQTFPEEELWSYETGVKSTWLDRRLMLNASLFYIDWTNQRFQRNVIGTSTDGRIVSGVAFVVAGKSEIFGLELESRFRPDEYWTFEGTLSLQDPKLKKFDSSFALALTGNSDMSGNVIEGAPRMTGSLSVGYDRVLAGDWDWFTRTDLIVRGSVYESEMNLAETGQSERVNLRLGVSKGDLRLSLYARNLFDNVRPLRASRSTDFGRAAPDNVGVIVTPVRGRQIGAEMTYRF